MKIIIAIIVAALIFLFLIALGLALKRVLNRYPGLNFFSKIILTAETIIWTGYIFWATDFLFREMFFYPYIVYALIFIIIIFVAWFLLKDLFAGIFFRINHNLKKGSFIYGSEIFQGKFYQNI